MVCRRRWHAFRWLWGKNRAVGFDLGLEFLFEAAAHPFAPLGLDFQFHVAQRTCGACFRVHPFTFRFGCSLGRGTDLSRHQYGAGVKMRPAKPLGGTNSLTASRALLACGHVLRQLFLQRLVCRLL
jgi:hypothetical protein